MNSFPHPFPVKHDRARCIIPIWHSPFWVGGRAPSLEGSSIGTLECLVALPRWEGLHGHSKYSSRVVHFSLLWNEEYKQESSVWGWGNEGNLKCLAVPISFDLDALIHLLTSLSYNIFPFHSFLSYLTHCWIYISTGVHFFHCLLHFCIRFICLTTVHSYISTSYDWFRRVIYKTPLNQIANPITNLNFYITLNFHWNHSLIWESREMNEFKSFLIRVNFQ